MGKIHSNMPKTARILRVVVASPSDVTTERSIVERVASELNGTVAADRNLRLEIARWETDAYPAFHLDGPQGVCDDVLKIEDSDILVGIFWTRFGTATPNGMTGTEHEIDKAISGWRENETPQIMIFFNTKAAKLRSAAERREWVRVAEYRERIPAQGLFWEYNGSAQFESEFRKCMQNYLRQTFSIGGRRPATKFRVDQKQTTERWKKLTIDTRVPAHNLPQVLKAFGDFIRQCGGLGLEVTLRRESD